METQPSVSAVHSETNVMSDLIFIAVAIGFFALSIAYTYGCEKLGRGAQ